MKFVPDTPEGFPSLYATRELAEGAAATDRHEYEEDCDGAPVTWETTDGEDGAIEWSTGGDDGYVVRITPLPLRDMRETE